jgi:hypothetical protein
LALIGPVYFTPVIVNGIVKVRFSAKRCVTFHRASLEFRTRIEPAISDVNGIFWDDSATVATVTTGDLS